MTAWMRLGLLCRDHRIKVLLGVVALVAPFAWRTSLLRMSREQSQLTPHYCSALETMRQITEAGIPAGLHKCHVPLMLAMHH